MDGFNQGALLKVHPVAELFPMLSDDELHELALDIRQRGLLMPIVLDSEGRILDGRNRYMACLAADVEPKFTTYDGEDPDGYALTVNITRRHLTTGSRAMITAKALAHQGKRRNGRWERGSVPLDEADTSRNGSSWAKRVSEAGLVLDWCDKTTVNSVIAGDKPLTEAAEEAGQLKQDDAAREAKKDRLREGAVDLLNLVDEESLSLDEAIALLDSREETARQEAAERAEKARLEADERSRQRREKEQVDRENRVQANSALARAVQVLDGVKVPEWRLRSAKNWKTGEWSASPTATDLVEPGTSGGHGPTGLEPNPMNDVNTLPISSIAVRERSRTELRNIDSLAESIETVGVLNPPTVRRVEQEWVLVAGERRLAAMRQLGWTDTPVTVAASIEDELTALYAERDENTQREAFSPSEMVVHARRIEARERELAKQRQGTRTDLQPPANLAGSPEPEPEHHRTTRHRVAKSVGTSHGTLAKARHVMDLAEDPATPPEVAEVAREAAAHLRDPFAVVDREHRAVKEAEQSAWLHRVTTPPPAVSAAEDHGDPVTPPRLGSPGTRLLRAQAGHR